jgi:hypothetical protein
MTFFNYRFVTSLKNKNMAPYLRTCTPERCVKILSCHRVTLAAGCIPNRPPAGTSPPLIATRLASATRNWLITILIDVCLDLLMRNAVSLFVTEMVQGSISYLASFYNRKLHPSGIWSRDERLYDKLSTGVRLFKVITWLVNVTGVI